MKAGIAAGIPGAFGDLIAATAVLEVAASVVVAAAIPKGLTALIAARVLIRAALVGLVIATQIWV